MKYRALITDLDGTLIFQGRQHISAPVTAALNQLQQKGVLVIYATGRGPYACVQPIIGGIEHPDYRICCNGAFIVDRDGAVLHERRMDTAVLQTLLELSARGNYHLNFTFDDAYYVYVNYAEFIRSYCDRVGPVPYILDGTAHTRHLESAPFCAFMTMSPQGAQEVSSVLKSARVMASVQGSYDIAMNDVDKSAGIDVLLDRLGIGWDEVVAIGDNENDIGMVSKAGMGIAMGNGFAQLLSVAKDVTAPVQDDGALAAIQKYFDIT